MLAWELFNTLEAGFCVRALQPRKLSRLEKARPRIANNDQGSQFTSGPSWIGALQEAEVRISVDGRVRAYDSVFVEPRKLSRLGQKRGGGVYQHDYRDPPRRGRGWIATWLLQP